MQTAANSSIVQSIVINKNIMNKTQATEWVRANYELRKFDDTNGTYRFEQYGSKFLKKLGFNRYFTRRLENGVDLVFAVMDPSASDYTLPG